MTAALQATDPALLRPMGEHGLSMAGIASAVGFVGIGLAFLGSPQLLTRFISGRDQDTITDASLIAVLCVIVFDIGAIFAGMAGPPVAVAEGRILRSQSQTFVAGAELARSGHGRGSVGAQEPSGPRVGPRGYQHPRPDVQHHATGPVEFVHISRHRGTRQESEGSTAIQRAVRAGQEESKILATVDPLREHRTHRCGACLTVYDRTYGEPFSGVEPGTPFEALPDDYVCSVCSAERDQFVPVNAS